MKDVTSMSDAELTALIEESDLLEAARKEMERRRDEAEGVKVVPLPTPCVRRTSKASCPSCGRSDSIIATKSLYASPTLAEGGVEPIGTAVYCKCRTWYDAQSGAHVDINKAYTY